MAGIFSTTPQVNSAIPSYSQAPGYNQTPNMNFNWPSSTNIIPTNYDSSFQGPVKPGDTIGGVNPLNQTPKTTTTTTNTGTGGGGGSTPTEPTPAPVDELLKQAEDAYNSTMSLAGQTESTLNAAQPGIEQNINNAAQQNRDLALTNKNTNLSQVAGAEADAGTRFKNALSAARQALVESGLGANQRFGAGSNISKALGEYATTQFGKVAGGLTDTLQSAMTQLSQQKTAIEDNFTNSMTQIGNWATEQINNARNELNSKLLEVAGMKNQAADAKAARNIQALASYRDSLNSIKMYTYQWQSQLYANTQTAAQQWQNSANYLAQHYSGNVNAAGTNQATDIASLMRGPGASPITYGSNNVSLSPSGTYNWIGSMTRKNENDLGTLPTSSNIP